MSFVAAATLGTGLISAGIGLSTASKQRKRANAIRSTAIDPGIQPNRGLARTSQILADQYSNFNLPGFTRYQEQIASNQANAMSNIREAATSSEDILSGAVSSQAVADESTSNLYTTQAQAKMDALNNYLNSVNAVGQDQVRVNNQELDRYNATMQEAAALEGASMQNRNNSIQDIMTSAQPLIRNFMPTMAINPATGKMERNDSLYKQYFRK